MSTVSPDGLTALCLSVGIARTGVIYVLNFVRHFMMPIHVGTGCLPATISDSRINHNARSDISPEMSAWEKIKAFFCPTHQCETLECFRNICHPPAGTTREDVLNRFEQLRTLAYSGYRENIQSGRHGENHFCILDTNSREVLSATLDDAGRYSVEYEGRRETHNLTMDTASGEKCAEHTEGESGTFQTTHAIPTKTPQTTKGYEAVWSAWERAASAEEAADRAIVVQKLRDCLLNKSICLGLSNLKVSSLPDHLPFCIQHLQINYLPLTRLPALPHGLKNLTIQDSQLTSLPTLPHGLKRLMVSATPLNSLPELPPKLEWMNLSNITPLSSLPALPHGLKHLMVSATPLSSLPALPHSVKLLDFSGTSLTSLPPLPHGLKDLSIRDTRPTNLPPTLPPGLKTLLVGNTSVTSLPTLPDSLKKLTMYGTSLTSLPPLPHGLTSLDVQSTPLTNLPTLPGSLTELKMFSTPLNSLPELPHELMKLYVSSTSLTSLPESIAGLSREATVTLHRNPLSERTRQALREMTSAPDYSGPRIEFDMADSSAPRETRALHMAVADWLAPVNEGEPAPADRWQAIGREDNAASFSGFLERLRDTENFRKDSGFKAQISSWLTQLAEDDELRAKTFAMATEATSRCEDRVTLALNHMKNVQLVHNAEKGEYDKNLPGLISVGREMFRLEKLEQIAREKVKMLRFVDEIEVWLGYQNKLKAPLGLTSITDEMRFFGVSHITESDLQTAEIQVKTAENSQFREWILQWEPLRSVLKRTEPERWEALSEKKISDYDDTYQTLSDTELKPAGLVGDTEAERTIGARAMESAEKAFLDGLRPMADKMLAGHLETRWS